MLRPTALLLASLLYCGCTTTKAIAPEPDDPRNANQVATPPTNPPTPPPPVTAPPLDDNKGPPPPDNKGPMDEARIGQPCGPGDTKTCGTKGRVATGFSQSTNPTKRLTAPCEMPKTDPNEPITFGDHTRGCVKDDRVYVHGSCMECRMWSEWQWVGLVAEMTDAQLEEAQKRAQLPKEPLLKTTSAWKTALATPPSKRKR